ncbi:MAG: hypothetical protein LBQ81_01350 [Zoogloeaceae bacterium]|jgi:serpin B|nr:hypothetical protein [Zoogloeaceae bacterium]
MFPPSSFRICRLIATFVFLVVCAQTWAQEKPDENAKDARFGFALLQQQANTQQTGNLLLAPRNIRTALAAVAVGAEGETRREILDKTNAYDAIDNANGKSFTNALHLWVEKKYALQEKFRNHFSSARVDSTTPEKGLNVINDYVRKHTKGKITRVLDKSPETFVLTSVFDFEGKWRRPFRPKFTTSDRFFVTPEKSRTVRFMRNFGHFDYAQTAEGQWLRLPYQEDDLVMTLFLPKPGLDIDHWLQTVTGDGWRAGVQALKYKEGEVELPRLSFRKQPVQELKPALQTIGIRRAFTDAAQFTGITQTPEPLKIVSVRHATMLEIDEQGTKAAAATAVGMARTMSAPSREPFRMKLDRPFFLTIGDAQNHKILFMAVIRDPSK